MAKTKTDDTDNSKEFNLKEIETNILLGIQQQFAQINALVLSYIAVDRLAYPINQNSQFELSVDMKVLKIKEATPEPPASQVEAAGDNDTANAIKG